MKNRQKVLCILKKASFMLAVTNFCWTAVQSGERVQTSQRRFTGAGRYVLEGHLDVSTQGITNCWRLLEKIALIMRVD